MVANGGTSRRTQFPNHFGSTRLRQWLTALAVSSFLAGSAWILAAAGVFAGGGLLGLPGPFIIGSEGIVLAGAVALALVLFRHAIRVVDRLDRGIDPGVPDA